MRRRIAVYGATDEALALLPALARRDDLELAWVFEPRARELRRRLALIEPGAARLLQQALTDDPRALSAAPDVVLVVDGGLGAAAPVPPPAERLSPAEAGARLDLPPRPWREPVSPSGERPAERGSAAPRHTEGGRPVASSGADADGFAESLARAVASGRSLALLHCDAAGPGTSEAPEVVARVRARAATALRSRLAPGERLGEAADGGLLALLLLDAEGDPRARVVGIARAAAERVARELADEPVRTPLVFGYALYPGEARCTEELRARAARPRIRML